MGARKCATMPMLDGGGDPRCAMYAAANRSGGSSQTAAMVTRRAVEK
jgi:hypothetical protein